MANLINADPTNGLKLISDSSSEIQLQANGVTKATLSSAGFSSPGHVLQVVQGSFTGVSSTTSTSMVSTSLNASITPTSSSSKILVLVAGTTASNTLNAASLVTIYRGATNLASNNQFAFHGNPVSGLNNWESLSMTYLDTPSTTSSTTYTVYLQSTSGTAYFGTGSNTNTITLLEIAG